MLTKLSSWWWSHYERLSAIFSYIRHVYTVDDRDWDYSYILTLLRWKLQRVEKSTEKWHGAHDSARKRQVRYAIFLIDRWEELENNNSPEAPYVLERLWRQLNNYLCRWWD